MKISECCWVEITSPKPKDNICPLCGDKCEVVDLGEDNKSEDKPSIT